MLTVCILGVLVSGSHSGGPPDVGQNNVTPTTVVVHVEKVWHPIISAGSSTEAWSLLQHQMDFNIRWSDYVTTMKITGQDCVIQLLECCGEDLQKDLTRVAGGTLTTKTEEEVLAAIKILAVREENAMVARVTLHEM